MGRCIITPLPGNAGIERKPVQRAMHCPCGRGGILALGMCATCYTLRRQDELLFGGLREAVLERDRHACRGCGQPGGRKRAIGVHHRRPGISTLRWMIALCPACHARVHRTLVLRRWLPPLLRKLWREQHPDAPEQALLPFDWTPVAIFPAEILGSKKQPVPTVVPTVPIDPWQLLAGMNP